MIGAASSTLAGNTVASAPASASDAAAHADVAAPGIAGRSKAASRASGPGDDSQEPGAAGQAFAEMLAPTPASAPPRPAAAGHERAEPGNVGTSPEQLLAMLDGTWSGAHAAQGANTRAIAQGAPATPGHPPALNASASSALATAVAAALPSGAGDATAGGGSPTADAMAATAWPAGDAVRAAQPGLNPDPSAAAALSSANAAESALPLTPEVAKASALADATAVAGDAAGGTQPGFAIDAPAAAPAPGARTQTAPALPMPPMPMPADPGDGFDEGFGTRLVWMAEQRMGHAEIRLNPEHVGPIGVRVQLDGDQVRAEFQSAHAEVRQAIEASLPRLREMLGQHGLQLGQADVGQGQAGGNGGSPGSAGSRDREAAADSGSAPQEPQVPVRTRGLLDAYA